MAKPYQLPVARLWSDDGSVVGAGFLAPRGVVVTCAHVVNAALGREQLRTDEPRGEIRLDLPWAAGKTEFRGSIIAWRPPIPPDMRRPDPCVDIAVLKLLGAEPPMEAALKPQSPAAVPEDACFRVMGFPTGSDSGAAARGTVRTTDADGWHLVEADRSYGRTIEPGFSGAPAIADDRHRRLLGMIDLTNADERRGALIPVEALMRAWPPLAEPYRGLQAFREEDTAYFFGRDALKARLWGSFERYAVTLLTGPSGAGKSSLLNAGFLPQLRRQGGWRLMRLRPGDQPMQRLGETLAKALKPQADTLELVDRSVELKNKLTSDPARLSAYARTLQDVDGARLCIIVDQFEETFTLAQPAHPDEHKAFLAALTSLATQQRPAAAKAVLGLRSDFQTMLQSDSAAAGLIAALDGDPTVLLRPLTPPELEQVIRGPLNAARLDVAMDDGLLAQLLNDIARDADALPLLEFALTELWAGMRIDRDRRSLSRRIYDEMGGIAGALAKQADAALDELKISEAEAKRLFVELVHVRKSTEQDARRPRSKAELDAIDPALWSVACRLADRRLLVTTEGPAADIVHEALLRQWHRVAVWIDEEREFIRWRQRLDERRRDWETGGQEPGDLLSGTMLDHGRHWLEEQSVSLEPSQKDFLTASLAAKAADQVRQQSDALWDRIELGWDVWERVPAHELEALLELARAPAAVRLEFLISAVTKEARARRLGRQPDIAARAAIGLDRKLAAGLAHALVECAHSAGEHGTAHDYALICLGRLVAGLEDPELPSALVERVVAGGASATDAAQLQAYAEVVRSFADRGEPARIDAAARSLVERALAGAAETFFPSQLQAYAVVVRSFTNRGEPVRIDAAARALVERVVVGVATTTWPTQLRAYGEVLRSVADRVEPEAAHGLVEQAVAGVATTTNADQLQAYAEVVRSFVNRGEPARIDTAARALVERAVAAAATASDAAQLQAYAEVVRSFADRGEPARIDAAARSLVERALAGAATTTDADQLQAYAEVVRSFADRGEPARIDAAARSLVERVLAGIATITDADQLQAYAEVVRSFADRGEPARIDAAARTLVERAVAGVATTTDAAQLHAYAEVVRSFADRGEPARIDTAARSLVERAVAGAATTTDADQLHAYAEVVRSFANRGEPAQIDTAVRALVERAVAGAVTTSDADQLHAYAEVVRSFADRIEPARIDAAARALVERAVAGIYKNNDEDSVGIYIEVATTATNWLPSSASIFILTELMKYPLSGGAKITDKLTEAIALFGNLPASAMADPWTWLLVLEERAPWLPLRRACSTPDVILSQFRRLVEDGPPPC